MSSLFILEWQSNTHRINHKKRSIDLINRKPIERLNSIDLAANRWNYIPPQKIIQLPFLRALYN